MAIAVCTMIADNVQPRDQSAGEVQWLEHSPLGMKVLGSKDSLCTEFSNTYLFKT